jgi:hypothetical protein
MYVVLSGKSVTGVLHFFNKTPIDWYSKKQNTVETATYTYGSENNAARAAIEQIKANKFTLMWLGVPLPLHGSPIPTRRQRVSYYKRMRPDNKLHKRHLMLSYHHIRENVAAVCIRFAFIRGEYNPGDSQQALGIPSCVATAQPILFWKDDTDTLNIANRRTTKGRKRKMMTIKRVKTIF